MVRGFCQSRGEWDLTLSHNIFTNPDTIRFRTTWKILGSVNRPDGQKYHRQKTVMYTWLLLLPARASFRRGAARLRLAALGQEENLQDAATKETTDHAETDHWH